MSSEQHPLQESDKLRRLQRFTHVVTIGLILGCNALLLLGLWVSGVNLERALSNPELFDPANAHCVRVAWSKVIGADGLVKVCTEWIDFSDISGKTHVLPQGQALAMGADGNLYFSGQSVDYRLIALLIFAIVVVISGMWVKKVLITKYQGHLQTVNNHST